MLALALVVAGSIACTTSPRVEPGDIDYAKLYASGESFAEFLGKAEQRKELWHSNYARASVPDALLARATRVTGTWHVLVVAVDGCSDSASTIPYIAKLVEQLPNVQLRIVNSKAGRDVMETHRTPDNRAATPTVILLDDTFAERGCWIERPKALQDMIAGENRSDRDQSVFNGKMAWYDKDQGQSTVAEFVEMLEAAGRGEKWCASS